MNWGGGGRSPSLTSLFSSVKGCFLKTQSQFFSYFKSHFLVLKKSFTLVELSIVLLVLALLVSTLLVGRQIIDRAKVQQIMSEIDYYTKNFQMFRDQYDFLPGSLDEANCRKYPEFSMQPGTDKTQFPSQCDDPDAMIAQSTNKYYTSYKQANKSMLDMVHSGMVENRSPGERRRKIYDIAEAEETTCVEVSAIRSGFYNGWKCDDASTAPKIGEIDGTKLQFLLWSCHKDTGFHYEPCRDNRYTGKTLNCNASMFATFSVFSHLGGTARLKNCASKTDTFAGYDCNNGANHQKMAIDTYLPLSTYGASLHKDEKTKECETKTIPGEKRRSYLLNKEEIEDNANRSTIGDKVWITYSSGNVDMNMTYGIGGQENKIGFKDSNTIVYFLYDESKSELEADGAVSYGLYDLLNKKMNGIAMTSDKVGMLAPISKTSGDGFNFSYAMRD